MTRKSFSLGALAVAGVLALGLGPLAAPAAQAAAPASNSAINGALQAGFATTLPATLQVQTHKHGLISVTVTSSTRVIRRYGGASALDEFSPGDNLSVVGPMSGTTAMTATVVKDNTIQRAFTRNVGTITAITPAATSGQSVLTIKVLHDSRLGHDLFAVGSTITYTVSSAMTVTLADGSKGTVANLSTGMTIVSLGIFNRHSHSFLSVSRIRVLRSTSSASGTTPAAGTTAEIAGVLRPGATSTTLVVRTPAHGLVTVTLAATATLTNRAGSAITVTQLRPGDRLIINGTWQGSAAFTATSIKDNSL